jgi:hypothetical protein
VSKESIDLKKMIKVPMLLFVTGAAMLASLSDLQIKLIGAVLEDATEMQDYLRLIPLACGIAYTAPSTLFYVNSAMKYYDQMEVMPVY